MYKEEILVPTFCIRRFFDTKQAPRFCISRRISGKLIRRKSIGSRNLLQVKRDHHTLIVALKYVYITSRFIIMHDCVCIPQKCRLHFTKPRVSHRGYELQDRNDAIDGPFQALFLWDTRITHGCFATRSNDNRLDGSLTNNLRIRS